MRYKFSLLPLDSRWRLPGDIVGNPGDTGDFINDAA